MAIEENENQNGKQDERQAAPAKGEGGAEPAGANENQRGKQDDGQAAPATNEGRAELARANIVWLKLPDYLAMVRHARELAPIEDCGLLAGTEEGGVRTVEKVFYLTNVDHSAEHFALDPAEQFAAVKEMRAAGWKLLGNWHSHPASPSRPSEEDKRLAFDSRLSYFILSLNGGEPVLSSFHIEKQARVSKEDLRIR